MELTNELKEKLETCKSADEAKALLSAAGVELTDELLERLAGGYPIPGAVDIRLYQRKHE